MGWLLRVLSSAFVLRPVAAHRVWDSEPPLPPCSFLQRQTSAKAGRPFSRAKV